MPASPVHHTPIDATKAWDGPAAEKAFDKVKGTFVKFYAWVDEGESDPDADGTDKEDGWGPHHDVDSSGKPGDANLKGVQAAMAALNGSHGGSSVVPTGTRKAVWNHLAAHYKDAGVKAADVPELKSAPRAGHTRADSLGAPDALPSYEPQPYRVDPDEDVTCPHCKLKDDTDASYCDQCGTLLVGRDDVKVGNEPPVADYAPEPYDPQPDETVQCPTCQKMDDPDARFCDQCGVCLVGRRDVKVTGPVEDIDDVDRTGDEPASDGVGGRSRRSTRDASDSFPDSADMVQCMVCQNMSPSDAVVCESCGFTFNGAEGSGEAADSEEMEPGFADPDIAEENITDDSARSAPKESLVRARRSDPGAPSILLRDDTSSSSGQSGSLMFGYFSTFNDWYEIDSWFEGQFLERVAPGAYQQTMVRDKAGMRVLFDHGFDPQLGNKPLGPITVLREDGVGAYYEVPLLDTDYNRNFVLPALRGQLMSGETVGSQLGASFRFIVTGETWTRSGEVTSFNPKGLPLRTITATTVLEFGPVTFPANESASSGVRCQSMTDHFVERLRTDPMFMARFTERAGLKTVERILSTPRARSAAGVHRKAVRNEGGAADSARVSQLRRRARALVTIF